MKLVLAFNLSRVYEHYKRKRFCIVSAYLMESDPEVNEARAKALKQVVRSRGYGYVEMEGHWIETKGKYKGQELTEWPLFIPEVTYEDAIYFGSGAYYPPEPKMQQSIIFADGEKIQTLNSTADGKWVVDYTFKNMQANLAESLKRWHERRQQLAGELPPPPGGIPEDDEYMGWSVLNPVRGPRPWRFSTVTLSMIEPPDPNESAGSWGDSMRRAYWSDRRPHDFYRPPKAGGGKMLLYKGEVYRKVDVAPQTLSKQVVALLRRKFRIPHFSHEIRIPEKNSRNWNIDTSNVLKSTLQFSGGTLPTKFSWHPTSGEFLLSTPSEMHANTIKNYGAHPFDEYVRGIVLHDQKIIATRPWTPNLDFMTTGDPEEDRAQQFMLERASSESQEACRRVMMAVGGVTEDWTWRFDISNADLQNLTGIFRW